MHRLLMLLLPLPAPVPPLPIPPPAPPPDPPPPPPPCWSAVWCDNSAFVSFYVQIIQEVLGLL